MCLSIDNGLTTKLEKRLKKGPITCYKKYRAYFKCVNKLKYNYELQTFYNRGIPKIVNSYIKSDRKSKKLFDHEEWAGKVNKGIHVYIDKIYKDFPGSNVVNIPVKCYLKNFIKAGNGEAVFMKIKVDKKEIEKAIRKINALPLKYQIKITNFK